MLFRRPQNLGYSEVPHVPRRDVSTHSLTHRVHTATFVEQSQPASARRIVYTWSMLKRHSLRHERHFECLRPTARVLDLFHRYPVWRYSKVPVVQDASDVEMRGTKKATRLTLLRSMISTTLSRYELSLDASSIAFLKKNMRARCEHRCGRC